jgi:hypothetical protein
LFFAVFSVPARGEEWSLVNETQGKNEVISLLSDQSGRSATVVSAASLGRSDLAAVSNSLNVVWAIPGMDGREASVRLNAEGFRLVAYPASFVSEGRDLMPFLPSGLSFYFRTTLFYDISLKVGGFIPKVTGAYISPEGLMRHISAAILMPELYLSDQSLLARLERLERALMAALKQSGPRDGVSGEMVIAVANICNENPGISPEGVLQALKAQKVKTNIKEVRAVYFVLFGGI